MLYACPMCFSAAADSPMVDAALIGIVALFAITVGVLGGFAAFIRHVARLSRQAAGEGNVRLEPDATEDR